MATRWQPGDVIVRREVLGSDPLPKPDPTPAWYGRAWLGVPVYVVDDTDEHLVTYIAPGAPFGFVDGDWPTPDARHPWHGREKWDGHGCLMVHRPGDHHAVWHFWDGPERKFVCWYINLQAAFRRTAIGYDTQDYELDLVVSPDGSWVFKDRELLTQRVAEGRFSPGLEDWIVHLGEELAAEIDADRRWWDQTLVDWMPDPAWNGPSLPPRWESVRS